VHGDRQARALLLLPRQTRRAPAAADALRKRQKPPLAHRFEDPAGKHLLWLLCIGMLAFDAAELPAFTTMGSHGTSVLGFERTDLRLLSHMAAIALIPFLVVAESNRFIAGKLDAGE
jgi:hypothetical protein